MDKYGSESGYRAKIKKRCHCDGNPHIETFENLGEDRARMERDGKPIGMAGTAKVKKAKAS